MAVIAMVLGSVLGLFGAVTGWMFYDMSVLASFGFYMIFSIVMFAMTLSLMMVNGNGSSIDDFGAAA
ncbi:MAG: hypothetical protein KDK26_02645 [Roseivivax sp.]|nr:hypothetical protein [Roseivivax sp.]